MNRVVINTPEHVKVDNVSDSKLYAYKNGNGIHLLVSASHKNFKFVCIEDLTVTPSFGSSTARDCIYMAVA